MSFIGRGCKNAFRNTTRTVAIILILSASIGLSLTMLISRNAVAQKIEDVKSSIGNVISISPAGARGFMGGGEPLTTTQVVKASEVANVTKVVSIFNTQMISTDTGLESAITPGTLGNRQRRLNSENSDSAVPAPEQTPRGNFRMGIFAYGSDDLATLSNQMGGGLIKLTEGEMIDAKGTDLIAVVGKDLATKNNLSVGSTFTAFAKTITVKGIFDSGNTFSNNVVAYPLKTLQTISGQTDEISSMTVTVSSVEKIDQVMTDLKSALGDTADVVSEADTAKNAIEPLQNILSITIYGLIGTLFAGAVTIFLAMMMIVRERRREIGIYKAIGASNSKVILMFVSEAVFITLISAIIGMLIGLVFGGNILQMLVATSSTSGVTGGGPGGGIPGGGRGMMREVGSLMTTNFDSYIGVANYLYGMGLVLLIAVIGSAIPAFLISKVKPAEVLKGE